MSVICFMIEPVFDVEGSIFDVEGSIEEDRSWNPQKRAILRWRRKDTGEEKAHTSDFGPGAMFYAVWHPRNWDWTNETIPHLQVICPNGRHWDIDSRASNCTLPNDKVHRCWIYHGDPPKITVDKRGMTCKAGGGSIQAGDYHGFLRNGLFT